MKIDFSEKIVGREKYFNSAVIVLIIKGNKQEYILFEKRSKGVRQGGDISFPGGKVEKDETSLEAALRECFEEIGLEKNKIKVLGKIGTQIISSGIIVDSFLGEVEEKELKKLNINESEVEECFLVPVEFFKNTIPRIEKLQTETKPYYEEDGVKYDFPAKELNLPKMYHKPWKSEPREVYMYIYNEKVIWGITAEIIREVLKYI